jgi:uracil-DNA glycosylase
MRQSVAPRNHQSADAVHRMFESVEPCQIVRLFHSEPAASPSLFQISCGHWRLYGWTMAVHDGKYRLAQGRCFCDLKLADLALLLLCGGMSDIRNLLKEAYFCRRCPEKFGFSISPNGGYFKFPPIIGANGPADILFVGINPRRSHSNQVLHDNLMASKRAFANLASNKIDVRPYIDPNGAERHYRAHLEVICRVFGEARKFDSCAAVTELFLCASVKSDALPPIESSCADKFLPLVLDVVQPKAIVAVGTRVMNYFKSKPGECRNSGRIFSCLAGKYYAVVAMPHPGNHRLPESARCRQVDSCVSNLREQLGLS